MEKGFPIMNRICTPYIWANTRLCTACGKCIAACPEHVIGKVEFLWHRHIIIQHAENCIGCKKCIRTCPRGVFSETMSNRQAK
ncbi:MAG: 4Fe-4S binding protein [Candidatus Azobacteroides sp.]|nr:4Fe-4S binding protein [Candidatus Azobacteroides sp.]